MNDYNTKTINNKVNTFYKAVPGTIRLGTNCTFSIYNGSQWMNISDGKLPVDTNKKSENVMKSKIDLKTKNVNSTLLFKAIDSDVRSGCDNFIEEAEYGYNAYSTRRVLRYEQLVDYLELNFEDLTIAGKIRVYDIICDHRNNTNENNSSGMISLTLRYRERNCINWTQLDYIITIVDFRP